MIISGNIVTLYPDETLLQPTPPNSFIVYTKEKFERYTGECLIVPHKSYWKILELFYFPHGYTQVKIEVRAYEEKAWPM